tara:strand:+ start:148 stop:285 length:138 start_codon:yes stop_codon:yes gene_type:complete
MLEQLQNYIIAVEANIVTYKKMGDEAAVKAAEGQIINLKALIANL